MCFEGPEEYVLEKIIQYPEIVFEKKQIIFALLFGKTFLGLNTDVVI